MTQRDLKQIRKQNLALLRQSYAEGFQQALAEQGLSVEDFCCKSKLPPETVFTHLRGGFRFFGELNYVCFCLNKRLKIEFMD